jgi:hypothetical protein
VKIISSVIKGTEEYAKLQQMYQDVVRQYNALVQKTSHILDAEEATERTRALLKTVQGEYNALVATKEQIDTAS